MQQKDPTVMLRQVVADRICSLMKERKFLDSEIAIARELVLAAEEDLLGMTLVAQCRTSEGQAYHILIPPFDFEALRVLKTVRDAGEVEQLSTLHAEVLSAIRGVTDDINVTH